MAETPLPSPARMTPLAGRLRAMVDSGSPEALVEEIVATIEARASGRLVDREAIDYEAVGRVLFEQSMSGSDITSAELEELWQEVREATIEEARAIIDAALTGVVD